MRPPKSLCEEFVDDPLSRKQLTDVVGQRLFLKYVLRLGTVALVLSLLACAATNSWMPLLGVWAVLGPLAGRISTYYFPDRN